MLKRERLLTIRDLVDQNGIMTVADIGSCLNVSTMTIRRDLEELASSQALIRIHGGAQSLHYQVQSERDRLARRNVNVPAKLAVAKLAASLVVPGDTVYIGPGTTNELIAQFLTATNVRIVTNSLPVFQSFQTTTTVDLELIGGRYRAHSGAFIGSLANEVILRLQTQKAFINVNGVAGNAVTNASPDEGQTQRIAFDNAAERFVLADHSKLDRRDFYAFYQLDQVDALITDSGIDQADLTQYGQYTKVLVGQATA